MAINQFQMTGDVSVILRSLAPTTINNISYIKNEVIASFTADVAVSFVDVNSSATTNKNELFKNDVFADSLSILPKQLNDGIYNIVGKRLSSSIIVPGIKTLTSNDQGEIYTNLSLDDNFFMVRDSAGDIVTGYTVDYPNGVVSGLTADTDYKLYYYASHTSITSLSFENIQIPYVRIELLGKGNINNESKSFLVVIPKAQINSAPRMNFDNSSIINVILQCNIINTEEIELHYY
jgi:hypothetical protein